MKIINEADSKEIVFKSDKGDLQVRALIKFDSYYYNQIEIFKDYQPSVKFNISKRDVRELAEIFKELQLIIEK